MTRSIQAHGSHARQYSRGLGLNRNTYEMGRAIGRGIKRGYESFRSARGASPPKSKAKRSERGIKIGKVYNEGTGGQYSYCNLGDRPNYYEKHLEQQIAPQTIVHNAATQLKSAVGLQNVANVASMFTPALSTEIFSGDRFSRCLYHKGTTDITFNNIFLSNCYVIIYDIVCRKDCSVNVNLNPLNAWVQGNTDLSASDAYKRLGSTPWQSELFNQYFKVVQTTNIVLGAGATHVHKVRGTPNKPVSQAYAGYTPYGLKDLTYHCMIEVHGSPANDTVNQALVSVGVAGLNIIVDGEETVKSLQQNYPTLSYADNSLPTSFTTAEQVVNLGGSVIQPNAEG